MTCHRQVIWIKGHGRKRIIVLKNDMKGKGDSFLKVKLIIDIYRDCHVIISARGLKLWVLPVKTWEVIS